MTSDSFNLIAPVLVITGITIGAVLAYLAMRSRHASRITLELITCNEKSHLDAIEFLEVVWLHLHQAGFSGIAWHADWYGGERWGESGHSTANVLTRTLAASDIELTISLFLPAQRGENRYFHSAIAETLFLLLQCDLWVKAGSVAAATAQLSRFSLFLRHDMKNFAQYLELLDDQVSACAPEHAERLLQRLQRTTPVLRQRAQRLLRSLQSQGTEPTQEEIIRMEQLVQEAADLHELEIDIEGQGQVYFLRPPLENALDNLFKNYADLARQQRRPKSRLRAHIGETPAGELKIAIDDPLAPPVPHPERLFEPFWSDSPGGQGIGLYQAKQSLARHDINLFAEQPEGSAPRFCFVFPPGFHAV